MHSGLIMVAAQLIFCARRTCPKSDARFKPLVERVTQNFDTFEDFGSNLDQDGLRNRVSANPHLDQFYDYTYRRVRKPRLPLPDAGRTTETTAASP